jgi:hypothetical protein
VVSVATIGKSNLVFGRWRRKREEHRADKQQGDVHALDRAGDLRGGVQNDEYRNTDPRDLVEEDGVVMSGPGGAPQEDESVEERRERDRG